MGLFEAASLDQVVALTKKTLVICSSGLVPTPRDSRIRSESWKDVYGPNRASTSLLHLIIRHYHPSDQQVLDLTDIERAGNDQTHVKAIRVLGDAVEIVRENVTDHEVLNFSQHPDESFRELSNLSKETIFSLYMEPPKGYKDQLGLDFLPKYSVGTTANACVIITESHDEYDQLLYALQQDGRRLHILTPYRFTMGEAQLTGGKGLPLLQIAANPLIVSSDALYSDELTEVLYSMVGIGEISSIIEVVDDIRDIIDVGKISLPSNLRRQLGVPRLNPLSDLRTLYGYRPLTQAEGDFYSAHHDLALLEHVGPTPGDLSHVEFELAFVHGLLGLIDLDDRIAKIDGDAIEGAYGFFCGEVAKFRKTLANALDEAESTLDRATTVVQMNLAIMAILWAGALAALPTLYNVMKQISDAMGVGLYVAGGVFVFLLFVSYMRLLYLSKS